MDGTYAGHFVWSPYKPRFVFTIYGSQNGSIVGYYDIETDFLKHALVIEQADVIPLDWGLDNLVSLEIKDRVTRSSTFRQLNPFSGELIGGSLNGAP